MDQIQIIWRLNLASSPLCLALRLVAHRVLLLEATRSVLGDCVGAGIHGEGVWLELLAFLGRLLSLGAGVLSAHCISLLNH